MSSSTGRSVLHTIATAVVAVLFFGLLGVGWAAPAGAAAPNGSVTPVAQCFWWNEDGTWSVLMGYRSRNAGPVTEAVGSRNRFTLGNANRGQPTTFLPGTQTNVFVVDITAAEFAAGIDWVVAGEGTNLSGAGWCSTKPVPADGNMLAVLAFGVLAAAGGSVLLSGRRRRLRAATV